MTAIGVPADLLTDRTAVVAGGTGNVGRVAVRTFLEAGATVVVPSRSERKLAELRADLGEHSGERLVTLVGDLSDEEDSERVRDAIRGRVGPLDAVVATLGAFVPAPSVLDAPLSDLERVLGGYLLAHFMVAKTLLPALGERSGSYTFINGPLAFRPMFPGTGLVSIATGGQAMLAQTIMKEEADGPVRINELVIYTRFGGGDAEDSEEGAVSRAAVGRYLARLVSDSGARIRGETIHLSDLDPLRALQSAS